MSQPIVRPPAPVVRPYGKGIDPATIGPATLAVTQAVASFFTFLPRLSEVRKAQVTDETAKDVRGGEFAASVVAIGVGSVITSLTRSPEPLYVSIAVCVILVLVYETTLRTRSATVVEE